MGLSVKFSCVLFAVASAVCVVWIAKYSVVSSRNTNVEVLHGGNSVEAIRGRESCDHDRLGHPPNISFHQITTYVGPVSPSLLHDALSALMRLAIAEQHTIVLTAVDGTLLNLLRWGCIVNDNDIDIAFFLTNVPHTAVMVHYTWLRDALARHGLIDAVTDRDKARFHHSTRTVKRGRCIHRGQLMQCVLRSGVMLDAFGPETLFSSWSGIQMTDVRPVVMCWSHMGTFPCPRRSLFVLQHMTLNGALNTHDGPRPLVEFSGCVLFTKRADESSAEHRNSIVESVRNLHRCGYPSMFSAEAFEPCGIPL